MEDQLRELHKLVSKYQLPDEAWNKFSSLWKPFSSRRKEILTHAGETERYLYFVTEGVQRVFFSEGDKESTLVFTYAPSFGGVLDSMIVQQPSRYFYETLTASTFLRVPYLEVQQLFDEHPAIQKMVLTGLSFAFSGVLQRLTEIQCYSSEERFRILLRRSPHLLQLIPHKYIATYLGIDATNFSKLINTVKI